jgi:hypothetical protein
MKDKNLFNFETRSEPSRFSKINVNQGKYLAAYRENKTIPTAYKIGKYT